MSGPLFSDVEARAQRRRTQTREDQWQDLVQRSWRRANKATDPAESLLWLERAHRMLPLDGMIALSLAASRLHATDVPGARSLFDQVAHRHGTPDAWAGLATCAHLMNDAVTARTALEAALRCSALTPSLRAIANVVAPTGWCALGVDGLLHASPKPPARIRLDGRERRLRWTGTSAPLPTGWRQAHSLELDPTYLGSPLPIRPFASVEGFVEAAEGGITGWAWQPADPSLNPTISVEGANGQLTITATSPADDVRLERPLGRPRRFNLPAPQAAALGTMLAIRGPDGAHLLGSPLDPALESRAAADPAHTGFAPVWADVIGPPPQPGPAPHGVAVVIPVHNGRAPFLDCIASVLATVPPGTTIIVVDDASYDPILAMALDDLAQRGRITLIRLPQNRGFPSAANTGIRAASLHDVVLLNSDTIVPPTWLTRLREAAYSAPGIGTVTPLTNDGTIVSIPDPAGGNPAPDARGTKAADAIAQRANGTAIVDLPVGVGFCLFLRRDCLDQIGLPREDLFAQGYGEENDLCLRARNHGWRNVAATGVYVAHTGAASFGGARLHLSRRNGTILERLHPGYAALVDRHIAEDPLHPARFRMDTLRWAKHRSSKGSVILVTHAMGGGVERAVRERAAAITAAGQRPIILRPHPAPDGTETLRLDHPGGSPCPNLIFSMPASLAALAKFLRADRPIRLELHHLLGHHYAVADLAAALAIPLVSVVHDFARFCPRIFCVSTAHRYCGEPDLPGCEACIADLGSLLEDDPPIAELRRRSAVELAAATQVIVPSADTAARVRRHFPAIRPTIESWEDDRTLPPARPIPDTLPRKVVVVGAIGMEKGFEVLLGCVRDAHARRLPLHFTVVGLTMDDERLLQAGPAFVTGEYKDEDAAALIRQQDAHLAFCPSVYPETWCYALTRAWQAGLRAAVFDLGAQAERVRATGRGWVFPLGIAPPAVNDALLRLAR